MIGKMMDINESITTFKETIQDHCTPNGIIQTTNTVAEELDEMDLLVYSDSDDEGRSSKLSMGHIAKPMEMISEGNYFI